MLQLRGLKPSKVAQLALCNPSTLSRAVRGEKPLGNRLRATVARVLSCDERDLLDPSPSNAVREAVSALNTIDGAFPLPARFDAAASDVSEIEQLALAALGLIRANVPTLAARVVERLLLKLTPETALPSRHAHHGRLLEWHDHISPDHLAPAQRHFLERARSNGGELNDGVLQPLVDDGCWSRTSIYCATNDLNIWHLASGLEQFGLAEHLWLHGRPARELFVPADLRSELIRELSFVRDGGGIATRHVRAILGDETYSWDCATARVGSFIIAACKITEPR